MPFSSVETAIQTALQAILAAASIDGLTSFVVRELPTETSELAGETLPLGVICPAGDGKPITSDGLDFEGGVGRLYVAQIAIFDGGTGDFATDQPTRQGWHEQVMRNIEKFQSGPNAGQWRTTLSGVSSVWDLRVKDSPTYDRALLAANYAYFSVFVEVRSAE